MLKRQALVGITFALVMAFLPDSSAAQEDCNWCLPCDDYGIQTCDDCVTPYLVWFELFQKRNVLLVRDMCNQQIIAVIPVPTDKQALFVAMRAQTRNSGSAISWIQAESCRCPTLIAPDRDKRRLESWPTSHVGSMARVLDREGLSAVY